MWATLLPYGLKIVSFLIDRSTASRKSKQRFVELMQELANDGTIIVSLHQSYRRQLDEIEIVSNDERTSDTSLHD